MLVYAAVAPAKQFALVALGKRVLGNALIGQRVVVIADAQGAHLIYFAHFLLVYFVLWCKVTQYAKPFKMHCTPQWRIDWGNTIILSTNTGVVFYNIQQKPQHHTACARHETAFPTQSQHPVNRSVKASCSGFERVSAPNDLSNFTH